MLSDSNMQKLYLSKCYLSYVALFLYTFIAFQFSYADAPVDYHQVRAWMEQLQAPTTQVSETRKRQLTAMIFYNSDVYRKAALDGLVEADGPVVKEFLRRKKELMRYAIQETNNRYRAQTGGNIKGAIIPFDYNNIHSDDDLVLSSGREGQRLEPLFNEALSDVIQEQTGKPFTAADRARIDVNGLSWDMTDQGAVTNFFHGEKYTNPQSGYANRDKLLGAEKPLVFSFNESGQLTELSTEDARRSITALEVDKPIFRGDDPFRGTGSMTDYWRMADKHKVKFTGALEHAQFAQFIRNQKYTERLVADFNAIGKDTDPELWKKYQQFAETSAAIRKQLTIKGLAEVMEQRYGVSIIKNGRIDADGMKVLERIMQDHQRMQLTMMPELVAAVTKNDAGNMIKWLRKNMGLTEDLRRQLALTYAPYGTKEIDTILGAIKKSDLSQKEIAWFETVLTKDTERIRELARKVNCDVDEFAKSLHIRGDSTQALELLERRNPAIKSLRDSMLQVSGGGSAYRFLESSTAKALNLDVIFEGTKSERIMFGCGVLLAATRAIGAASKEEGLKAVGMGLFEMIPFVSATLRLSELEVRLAVKEFIMDVVPPLILADLAFTVLKFSLDVAASLFTEAMWDKVVDEALRELSDDDFEKTPIGFYQLKNRDAYLNYLDDVSAGMGRVVKLASLVAKEVEARLLQDQRVQTNKAALHSIEYLEGQSLDALTEQVRKSGMPPIGTVSNSYRVAAKLILEIEDIRKGIEREVLKGFIDRIEKAYNEKHHNPDEDLQKIIALAISIITQDYNDARDRFEDDSVSASDLVEEYTRVKQLLENYSLDGKDARQLEQEMMQIIDAFRAFIKGLDFARALFEEANIMQVSATAFGGANSQIETSSVLLSDQFRLAVSARVKPERAGLPWAVYYYVEHPVFGFLDLVGSKSLSPRAFNPGNDGLWPVEDWNKAGHLLLDFSLVRERFNVEGAYTFYAVFAFGGWRDPASEVGFEALKYPSQNVNSFRENKVAFISQPLTIHIVRPVLHLSMQAVDNRAFFWMPVLYVDKAHSNKTLKASAYLEVPDYAVNYSTSAEFSVFGPVNSVMVPSVNPSNVSALSLNKDNPTLVELSATEQVPEDRYTLRAKSQIAILNKESQPFEALRGFYVSHDSVPVNSSASSDVSSSSSNSADSSVSSSSNSSDSSSSDSDASTSVSSDSSSSSVGIQSDEFMGMSFFGKDGQGKKFKKGDNVTVRTSWRIMSGAGSSRQIRYRSNGAEFFSAGVIAPEGSIFSHEVTIATNELKGNVSVDVDLVNTPTGGFVTGHGSFVVREERDQIVNAYAAADVAGQQQGNTFGRVQNGKVYVHAWIQAEYPKDGTRKVKLYYKGKPRLEQDIVLKDGEGGAVHFFVNMGSLKGENHVLGVRLYNEFEKQWQDSTHVRFKIKGQAQTPQPSSGGLQDVYCTEPNVVLKVWDHSDQDDDIISLRLGQKVVMAGANLNQCGGPAEPQGGACVHSMKLPKGKKIAVSVYAHTTGKVGPNTASLKVEGGCTPSNPQMWSLNKGQQASIWIFGAK